MKEVIEELAKQLSETLFTIDDEGNFIILDKDNLRDAMILELYKSEIVVEE